MYRLLRRKKGSTANASTRRHGARAKRVHQATRPNQVWSWDITWLPTIVRGRFFFPVSRPRRLESPHHWLGRSRSARPPSSPRDMITRICRDEHVDPDGLVLHSDNGTAMRGKHDARDDAAARHRALLQSAARVRRQRVLRGALSDLEARSDIPAPPLHDRRRSARVGSSASSLGTTANIVTAAFASSRRTSATTGARTPSSAAAARSTRELARSTPSAGLRRRATGRRSAP